jgi:hypothetical protein
MLSENMITALQIVLRAFQITTIKFKILTRTLMDAKIKLNNFLVQSKMLNKLSRTQKMMLQQHRIKVHRRKKIKQL